MFKREPAVEKFDPTDVAVVRLENGSTIAFHPDLESRLRGDDVARGGRRD